MRRLRTTVRIAGVALLGLIACGCVHQTQHSRAYAPTAVKTNYQPGRPFVGHRPQSAPDQAAEFQRRLDDAFGYALDYALACTLADLLQTPVDQIRRNPLRCGLQAGLEDALEWGLRHVLDADQKSAAPGTFQAARQRALTRWRAQELATAVEAALQDIAGDPPTKHELKDVLVKALNECLAESLDHALDNALHGESETLAGQGPFIWPVNHPSAYITSTFGYRGKATGGNGHLHTGIDIVVPKGTPIAAVADGVITFARESGSGYGRLVKLDHGDGTETWYAHVDSFCVHEGDTVTCGDLIAKVGQTGHATTAHLHYEVHENGQPVDPRPYLP